MIRIARNVALLMLISIPAHADWVDRAWDRQAVEENRIPAITLNETGVLLVLPKETLDEAHRAGLSTPQAAERLLQRYGQRCASVIDLNRPHPHLKVRLFLEHRITFRSAPPTVKEEIGEALTAKSRQAEAPDTLSLTSDESSDFFIDYVPERTAHCVLPGSAAVS